MFPQNELSSFLPLQWPRGYTCRRQTFINCCPGKRKPTPGNPRREILMHEAKTSVARPALSLFLWVAISFSAASSAIFVKPDDWYLQLSKPSWNPPSWLFGPVWSLLYLMMGIAAWMIWSQGGRRENRLPLSLFFLQLLLNAIWSPLFFGLHRPGLALVDIALLWLVLSSTVFVFFARRKNAGRLLVPYLAWVSFAAFLNFTIWRLNA